MSLFTCRNIFYNSSYIKMLIFLERTFKSIAMDTDFIIDIVYHRVIGYVR